MPLVRPRRGVGIDGPPFPPSGDTEHVRADSEYHSIQLLPETHRHISPMPNDDITAEIEAAKAHAERQARKADAPGPPPMWTAWALRMAFIAGIQWERDRVAKEAAEKPPP